MDKPIIFTMENCYHCERLKFELGPDCEYFEFRNTTGENNKKNLDMAMSYGIKLMPSIVFTLADELKVIDNPEVSFVRALIQKDLLIQKDCTQETCNGGQIINEAPNHITITS